MIDYDKVICVTDLKLAGGRILEILKNAFESQRKPYGCILRAKELDLKEYMSLAADCKKLCSEYGVQLTVHSFPEAALELGIERLHMPLRAFEQMTGNMKERFAVIGTSVHSKDELRLAMELCADYVIAGHIFDTDCKKGLAGRGLIFLKDMVDMADIPVYAIGGIGFDEERNSEVLKNGASKVCIMSEYMKSF